MILVDTSVWVDHFRNNNEHLQAILKNDMVTCHELVIGELACGNFKNRKKVIGLLQNLPQLPHVKFDDFLRFVEEKELYGKGIGYVDIHLLASAELSRVELWTFDKRLKGQAERLNIEHKP